MALQQYSIAIISEVATPRVTIPDQPVTIVDQNGTLANLYEDKTGLIPKNNPANSNAIGVVDFYADENADYTAMVSVGSQTLEMPVTNSLSKDFQDESVSTLDAIAHSLNVPVSAIIYSTDTATVLDNVQYIYDASSETTWSKPSGVQTGDVIISVVGNQLTVTSGDYTMYKSSSIPNNANMLQNSHFYQPSPDSAVFPPPPGGFDYTAGQQVFLEWFVSTGGITGLSRDPATGLINSTSGSIYQDVPKSGALGEYKGALVASWGDNEGHSTEDGAVISIDDTNPDFYRVTLTPNGCFSAKMEQGVAASKHKALNLFDIYGHPDVTGYLDPRVFGSMSSQSVQDAVNFAGNAITYAVRIRLVAGVWDFTKPVLIYQKDGMSIVGDGKWATKIQMTGAMTPDIGVVPTWPADGAFRGYTYTDKPCAFMVAARRVTGGADGDLNPAGANAAAWNLSFSDFTILGEKATPSIADGFYIPDFGNGSFDGIDFQYVKAAWSSSDCYRTRIEHCNINNSFTPFDHFSTGSSNSQGTTLGISNCGASLVEKGWGFTNMNYSSFNNVSCDSWGYTDTSASTKYAWSFDDCNGISMNGCGAEMLSLAVPQGDTAVLNVGAGSFLTIESCLFLSNTPANNSEQMTLLGNTNINNTEINLRHNSGISARAFVRGGSHVISNSYGNLNASDLFDVIDGALVFETPNMKPDLVLEEHGVQVIAFGGYQPVPHSDVVENAQLISNNGGTTYTVKQKGRYKVVWDYSVEVPAGGVWNNSRVVVNGRAVSQKPFNGGLSAYDPTHTVTLDLISGDAVQWQAQCSSVNCLINTSTVSVERVY